MVIPPGSPGGPVLALMYLLFSLVRQPGETAEPTAAVRDAGAIGFLRFFPCVDC